MGEQKNLFLAIGLSMCNYCYISIFISLNKAVMTPPIEHNEEIRYNPQPQLITTQINK